MWDFPRPPRLERTADRLTVVVAGRTVADTTRGFRVLETSQAPSYYFPAEDVDTTSFRPSERQTFCEWKGRASYVDLVVGDRFEPDAAWTYRTPTPAFTDIAGYYAFYAQRADRCTVGDDVVSPNDGDFYGGWITPRVVGPFKGGAGTWGW